MYMSAVVVIVYIRNIGQITDNVCDGVYDALSRPVHVVCLTVQLGDESILHSVVVRHDISHVLQVPRHIRPQPRLFPCGVSRRTDGWTCRPR